MTRSYTERLTVPAMVPAPAAWLAGRAQTTARLSISGMTENTPLLAVTLLHMQYPLLGMCAYLPAVAVVDVLWVVG